MSQRIVEMDLRPKPLSLTPEELDFDTYPITHAKEPIKIAAWVRYSNDIVYRAEGTAIGWTSRAVHIKYKLVDNTEQSAWVWASSVDRL